MPQERFVIYVEFFPVAGSKSFFLLIGHEWKLLNQQYELSVHVSKNLLFPNIRAVMYLVDLIMIHD